MKTTGIDVSHFQGTIDWSAVAASDMQFAFAKATQGAIYIDPQFARNWIALKDAGITRGAYAFFDVDANPQTAAQHFINGVHLEAGDLPPVVDVESIGKRNADNAQLVANLRSYLNVIDAHYGVNAIIYTGPAFWSEHGDNSFGDHPLWLAQYASHPTVPTGWTNWTFWQYTDSSTVPGVNGKVDGDYFNGNSDELQAITVSGAV